MAACATRLGAQTPIDGGRSEEELESSERDASRAQTAGLETGNAAAASELSDQVLWINAKFFQETLIAIGIDLIR